MDLISRRDFANGSVYCLRLQDGLLVETTDTFLPFYTKDAQNTKSNILKDYELGDRSERWMIGVSTMSGCPVRCKFCATGKMKKWRNLTSQEIVDQVVFAVEHAPKEYNPLNSKEFKINYTRMGEPFLNIEAVKEAIRIISEKYPNTHHYVSTIGIKGSDFSWIKGNISLQISLHSFIKEKRDWLIPFKNKLNIEELGRIRTDSNLKTTLNLTLVDEEDFDIEALKRNFDKNEFFIKLSPINPNEVSEENIGTKGVINQVNLL